MRFLCSSSISTKLTLYFSFQMMNGIGYPPSRHDEVERILLIITGMNEVGATALPIDIYSAVPGRNTFFRFQRGYFSLITV
jgi:hypothetical protein